MDQLVLEPLLDPLGLLLLEFRLDQSDPSDLLLPLRQSDPESPVPLVSQSDPSLPLDPGFPEVLWLPLGPLDQLDQSCLLHQLGQSDRLLRLGRLLRLHLQDQLDQPETDGIQS